jgi:hypothetical protein
MARILTIGRKTFVTSSVLPYCINLWIRVVRIQFAGVIMNDYLDVKRLTVCRGSVLITDNVTLCLYYVMCCYVLPCRNGKLWGWKGSVTFT